MQSFQQKVAVITGAGSGIGKALALALAREGARLALNDIHAGPLAATAEAVRAVGAEVLTEAFSVADRQAMFAFADRVIQQYGHVDLVVNNAGYTLGAVQVHDVHIDDFQRIMEVNFWGVVHGTQAFLPHLMQRPEAIVANVSSLFGITSMGLQVPYCTSKFAVRGFTEGLRMELKGMGAPVRAVAIHPGGIRTDIARSATRPIGQDSALSSEHSEMFTRKLLRMPPEEAADIILDGFRRGRERILIGKDARWGDRLARLFPEKYTDLFLKRLQRVGFKF